MFTGVVGCRGGGCLLLRPIVSRAVRPSAISTRISAARWHCARDTSRWVTARIVRGPKAKTRTPRSRARATTAGASGASAASRSALRVPSRGRPRRGRRARRAHPAAGRWPRRRSGAAPRPGTSRRRAPGPRLRRGEELLGGEEAPGPDLCELDSRVSRRAGLVPDRVALAAYDDVVARPGQHPEGDLVCHRPGRQPQRRLLSQERRGPPLEEVYRGVFAELVFADRGGGDGGPHLWRGASDGVRAQVNGGVGVGHRRASRMRASASSRRTAGSGLSLRACVVGGPCPKGWTTGPACSARWRRDTRRDATGWERASSRRR